MTLPMEMRHLLPKSACIAALVTSTALTAQSLPDDPVIDLRAGTQVRAMGNGTNFDAHPPFLSEDQAARSFADFRLRGWINVGEQRLGGYGAYAQVQIGSLALGDDREFGKTHGTPGDAIGTELRRGFLWLMPDEDTILKLGVQGWHDAFGERPSENFADELWAVDDYDSMRAPLANSVWDFNLGGVSLAGNGQEWDYRLGAFLLSDGNNTFSGHGGSVLATGDLDLERSGSRWGASLYYLRDNGDYSYGTFGGPGAVYDSSEDLWFGVRGHLGEADHWGSFFLIYNQGRTNGPDWNHRGVAARIATGFDALSGRAEIQGLFATGDDGSSATRSNEFRTIAQSARDDFGAQGYWSLLGLTSPRGSSDGADLGVSLQNQGYGLATIQASWARSLTERVDGVLAAGWLQSAEPHASNGSRDLGFEVLGEVNWRLRDHLQLDFGLAYLFTGDFYRAAAGGSPENLYEVFLRVQFEF
ncbi:MAG: hypothetical protein DWQ01_07165 [Planctomycetota bacterium]|nr:MAG: hypothetical protein DWQ01_07165 [Planctomycetota bacterium]